VTRLDRRGFLRLAGGAGAAGLVTAAGVPLAGCGGPEAAGVTLASAAPLPKPFAVPLPVPPVARPVRADATTDHYEVTQRIADARILPGRTTRIWGYDGVFPGPTFEARAGRQVSVRVRNELPTPTSTHLHGGVTPPESDGYPTDLVVPAGFRMDPGHLTMADTRPSDWTLHDGEKTYRYPMAQRAGTLWYHDHRMDFSAPQVWRGLLGMLVVRDGEDDALPLPKGGKDVPLVICDRSFEADGSIRYPWLDPTLSMTPGVEKKYMQGVEGDVILVNGAPWPELEVTATRYRFRILNASNARRYRLALTGGGRFTQVGSDHGLLPAPVRHDTLTVAPAERFDVVVDFSAYRPGDTVTLVNRAGTGPAGQVMRFRVTRRERDSSVVPAVLSRGYERLRVGQARATRQFDFQLDRDDRWTVNKRTFAPAASLASPALGSVERWRFTSDFHHPVHVHLAPFQVLSRDGKAPPATDAGWKDTVDLRPYEAVEVLIRFDGYRGRYLVHCHNLEHEDMAMMANFRVV
jgi:spore coat protein A